MKANLLTLFLLTVVLSACQEDEPSGGDILQFDNYFQIVDATTGEDWFIASNDYDPSEVKLEGISQNGEFIELVLEHTKLGEKNVFGPVPGFITEKDTTTYLLSLSDTDTDTIFFDVKDCTRCEDGNYLRYESFAFYCNGKI